MASGEAIGDSSRRVILLTGCPPAKDLTWDDEWQGGSPGGRQQGSSSGCAVPPRWRPLALYSSGKQADVSEKLGSEKDSAVERSASDILQSRVPDGINLQDEEEKEQSMDSLLSHVPLYNACQDDDEGMDGQSQIEAPITRGSIKQETIELLEDHYENSFALYEQSDLALSASSLSTDAGPDVEQNDQDSLPGIRKTWDLIIDRELNHLRAARILPLTQLPDAEHLQNILPQTMTVDLIVGIVSIAPAKSITIRKTGQTMDVVELVVGDDTYASLLISIWLPCRPSRPQDKLASTSKFDTRSDELRQMVSDIQRQDIIFFRHLALSTFRGQVQGQSLQHGTSLTLLHRFGLQSVKNPRSSGLFQCIPISADLPQLQRMTCVMDWVVHNVIGQTRSRGRDGFDPSSMPPDTQ